MISKLIEIRDRATFIPALAVKFEAERLAWRAGFGPGCTAVLLVYLAERRAEHDPYAWGDRTLRTAHLYIEEHFDQLRDAEVVDVEYILGETAEPKRSEM
jgi:hypothetical protein